MITPDKALELLIEKDSLWRTGTRHEALMLVASLAHSATELRPKIYETIINGPSDALSLDDDRQTFLKFEFLSYLAVNDESELPEAARQILEFGRSKEWDPDLEHAGMSVYSVSSDRMWPKPEHPSRVNPLDAVGKMTGSDPDADWSARDRLESIGYWAIEDEDWGKEFFDGLKDSISDVHPDALSPLLWGIRKSVSEAATDGLKLLKYFESLVDIRSDPELWASLPSLIQEVAKQQEITPDSWDSVATKLGRILASFDYQRDEDNEPVEWLNRAINHPIGDIVELYLDVAQAIVSDQHKSGLELALDERSRKFFELVLERYDVGSRYAVCILSRRVSWFEAVDGEWTENNLLPYFNDTRRAEAQIVAWAGYAWSNRLSRSLFQDFENDFLPILLHWERFGKSEQRGLTRHIAALAWYEWCDVTVVERSLDVLPHSAWSALIKAMTSHLQKAEPKTRGNFTRAYLIPIWRWVGVRADELGSSGTKIFEALWRTLPFTGDMFVEAAKIAMTNPPSMVDDVHYFASHIQNIELSDDTTPEIVDVLIALLGADGNPHWHARDWRAMWDLVRDSGVERLDVLRDELARRDVHIEG